MSVELWWKEDGLLLAHLSLLGHISGELGLDEVSDFISWEECPKSGVFWAPETLSHLVLLSAWLSEVVCRRGNSPERRLMGLLDWFLAAAAGTGGEKVVLVTSPLLCAMPPLRLPGMPAPWCLFWLPTMVSIEWLRTRMALLKDSRKPP